MNLADLFEEAATLARGVRGPGYRAIRLTRIESPQGAVTWAVVAVVDNSVRATAAAAVGDGACDDAAASIGDGPEAALTALCARLRGAP